MRIRPFLLLLCVAAVPLLGQENAGVPPTVTDFKCPKYPDTAYSMGLQGMVILQVTTDGRTVSDVKLVSGHPALAPEAFKNVRTRKFADHTPTTFKLTYYYVFQGPFKRDKITKCDAKMELPSKVTVSTSMPLR